MKIYGTSAICPKCGKQLYISDIEGYNFVCKECDENFYTIEVTDCAADFWEINIPMSIKKWERKLSQWQKISEKYRCDFLEYDDVVGILDIGWANSFPESSILNQFVKEIKKL